MIRVYAGPCCTGSDRARELVAWVLASHPEAEIEVVEVDDLNNAPDSLFALPTWYWYSEVWKLGNPSESELLAALEHDVSNKERRA